MSEVNEPKVFILTTERVVGWDCETVLFSKPLVVKSFAAKERDSRSAYEEALKDLANEARSIGANVVLATKFNDPEFMDGDRKFVVRATGTAARIFPPLPDPKVRIAELERDWSEQL